jgi:thioredoxin-like negative regulator of GroEL
MIDCWKLGCRNRNAWIAGFVAAVLLSGGVMSVRPMFFGENSPLREAAAALYIGRYAGAERQSLDYLELRPTSHLAYLIAADAAAKQHANARSERYLSQLPDDESELGVQGLYARAHHFLRSGRATEAEQHLRRTLNLAPLHFEAAGDLAYLLEVEGRSWEALPYAYLLIQSGRMSGDHLRMVGSTEANWLRESAFVEQCQIAVPDDPLPLLGNARRLIQDNDAKGAQKLLEEIVRAHPMNAEAQARLGRLLLDADNQGAFLAWNDALSTELPAHPDVWVNQGLWANRHKQPKAAVRCFLEAVRLHPQHGLACNHLSQSLSAIGETKAAAKFAERARKLSKVDYLLADVGEDVESYRRLAEALEDLGRDWEAAGWYEAAWQFREQPKWAGPALQRAAKRLQRRNSNEASNDRWMVENASFFRLPLPDFGLGASRVSEEDIASDRFGAPKFANVAADVGLQFQYYNGQDADAGRAYMFEFNGGGVAVLDYDNDGWPDLYLTQGCHWPHQAQDHRYHDRLFRNLGTGRFRDVTAEAGLAENGFSSGVTIGDIDNDGWPDIYVCNIGPNRLYRNNGDGTFADVTQASQTAGNHWSSGAAFGDFNQDGMPDLYVVNYLAGPDVYERACEDEGRPVQCGPTLFEAEQDRLYINRGDGSFEDVTESSGIVAPDGKGLGIVVGDLSGSGRLDVFVANDTTANFLFRNDGPGSGAVPQFTEQALTMGAAFDEEGNAQACMGVAAGDVNDDGRTDLFITNFYRQPNTLYVQEDGGIFLNQTRSAGLFDSSFLMLGWGTQFLDAELDGLADLVLVNGHVNDFRHSGTPYHMRAQMQRKVSRERFEELASDTLGPYFSELHLGRSLARLDWNRDGREDFCVTHIDAPAALLENRTSSVGNFLSIRLVGVTGARDAIGAKVSVVANGQIWHRELTSGDGFQASNERALTFGLGEADTIESVRVRWPADVQDTVYPSVPVGTEITIIEGHSNPYPGIVK